MLLNCWCLESHDIISHLHTACLEPSFFFFIIFLFVICLFQMYIKLHENDYYNILEIISTKKVIKITEEWSVIPLVEGLLLCMKAKFQSSASHKPCVHVYDSTT